MKLWGRFAFLGIAFALALPATASLDPFTEVVQTMMDVQGQSALVLGVGYGADASSLLSFSTLVNSIDRTFTYSLAPGTSYLGQSLSLSGFGVYDSVSGQYDFGFSGGLGSESWSATGSGAWVGDPEFDYTTTFDYKGQTYTVNGKITVDGASSLSTHTATFTGPPGGAWPGPFGPYAGTGRFLEGHWRFDIPKTPIGPIFYFSQGEQSRPDVTGLSEGTFFGRLSPVPGPGSLLVTALTWGSAVGRRRFGRGRRDSKIGPRSALR